MNTRFSTGLENIGQQEVYVEHSKERLDNEGFALMDELDENTSNMEQMQYDLSETKDVTDKMHDELMEVWEEHLEFKDWFKTIRNELAVIQKEQAAMQENLSSVAKTQIGQRLGVLEGRRVSTMTRKRKDKQTTIGRTEIAYGGDIFGDIKAIQCVEEQGSRYVAEYKDDFLEAYAIPFDDAVAQTPSYPPQVIRAFNIHASVHDLDAWPNQKAIQGLAEEIIAFALSATDELLACFGSLEDLQEMFHKMERLFRAKE